MAERPGAAGGQRLIDPSGRALDYLRLSVTDRCNFRCAYCLPDGCPAPAGPAPLALDEIGRLARAFAGLGFRKVRVTGGEPTLRRDLVEIVECLAGTPGIERVGLTTNGSRLADLAEPLRAAGLGALNVSLDSLDPVRFEAITGVPSLRAVLEGLGAAVGAGIPSIKVNAVMLRGLLGAELEGLVGLARGLPIEVRFIELMRTDDNAAFHGRNHLPPARLAAALLARGWREVGPGPDGGVATRFAHPDHAGRLGIIAAEGGCFCARCNRLRVTASGDLRPCLFGRTALPLRDLLARDEQLPALEARIAEGARRKPAGHRLREGDSGGVRNLAVMGG